VAAHLGGTTRAFLGLRAVGWVCLPDRRTSAILANAVHEFTPHIGAPLVLLRRVGQQAERHDPPGPDAPSPSGHGGTKRRHQIPKRAGVKPEEILARLGGPVTSPLPACRLGRQMNRRMASLAALMRGIRRRPTLDSR
jgi:hypothetical protein